MAAAMGNDLSRIDFILTTDPDSDEIDAIHPLLPSKTHVIPIIGTSPLIDKLGARTLGARSGGSKNVTYREPFL